jgi:hypothetical protein
MSDAGRRDRRHAGRRNPRHVRRRDQRHVGRLDVHGFGKCDYERTSLHSSRSNGTEEQGTDQG